MQPKKQIKKLNNFRPKNDIPILQVSTRPHRYILDLGPYGEYFVNSEIPSINNSNFNLDYFGEIGRYSNPIQLNPIRVMIRDVIRDGDLLCWASPQSDIYMRRVNATLMSIDPLGDVLSEWHLIGCRLCDFLINYESSDIIEFTIVMDHFVLRF